MRVAIGLDEYAAELVRDLAGWMERVRLAKLEERFEAERSKTDAALAEKTAADFDVRAFTDVTALLASGAVDAVVIATPAGTHGDIARVGGVDHARAGHHDAGMHGQGGAPQHASEQRAREPRTRPQRARRNEIERHRVLRKTNGAGAPMPRRRTHQSYCSE